MVGEYINVKGHGYLNRKQWYEMTDKEKFIDICEGTFIRNPYGTNYFSDASLRTIDVCSNLLLKTIKVRL